MADPTSENKLANAINSGISNLIEGAGEKEVKVLILGASAQILAIPIIGWIYSVIVDVVVSKLGKFFYIVAARVATKVVIDLQVDNEVSDTKDSFQNLQMALASGDPDAIKMASDNLSAAYVALGHSNGWSTNIK